MIVADTGAVIAMIDADEAYHEVLRRLFKDRPSAWVLPWAVLPEVDHLLLTRLGTPVELAFLDDLAEGSYPVEWGVDSDLTRARELCRKHRALRLGLVDGVVMAVAERLKAEAIATLDLRHFAAVTLRGDPRLLPRDL